MASTSDQTRGYVVTMMEFVTSSGMNRVSPTGAPSSRKLGPRGPPVVGPKPGPRVGATLDWLGRPGAPGVVGRVGVVGVVVVPLVPDRPKIASSVAARSFALVFSAK